MENKGINKEDLKQMIDYVFRDSKSNNSNNTLFITDNKDMLAFRSGNITTGVDGIKNIYQVYGSLGITDINYNGILLNEDERKIVLEKIFKK